MPTTLNSVWLREFGVATSSARTGSGPNCERALWINNYRKTGYSAAGGYKQSGLGQENGANALLEYTEEKSVWVDTGQGVKDPFNPRA